MKRTSIVGPLILIGLGVLFLARNLNPNLPVLDYLARFWPFILIGWGVLRVIEIISWRAQNKPLPMQGIAGGEWALIVFLCFVGMGVSAYNNAGSWWRGQNIRIGGVQVFGESFDYPIEGKTQASKTPKIIIESFRGNARITGADTDEVRVTGRKSIRALKQQDADQASKDTPLEVVRRGDDVVIRTYQDRVSNNIRVEAEMEITVPKGASIEARGRRGDFDISNITGNVDIDSDNTGVRLSNIGGSVKVNARASDILKAENVKGGVEFRGQRGSDIVLSDVQGQVIVAGNYTTIELRNLAKPVRYESSVTEFSVEKLPGEARLDLGDIRVENAVGPIRVSSKSRDVQIREFTNGLDLSIERGDIELSPAANQMAQIDVKTRSGDIELNLPGSARFDLNASTDRGELNNEFGEPLRTDHDNRGGKIAGTVGSGPKLSLHTNRGQVTVRRGSGAVAPAPPSSSGPRGAVPPPPPPPTKLPKPTEQ
jgi:DUF4097 and DUF4098 domain-containing protein YvlB